MIIIPKTYQENKVIINSKYSNITISNLETKIQQIGMGTIITIRLNEKESIIIGNNNKSSDIPYIPLTLSREGVFIQGLRIGSNHFIPGRDSLIELLECYGCRIREDYSKQIEGFLYNPNDEYITKLLEKNGFRSGPPIYEKIIIDVY